MSSINDLVAQAKTMNIKIYLSDGQIKINMPWPVGEVPEQAFCVINELKTMAEIPRSECLKTGHCLALTLHHDCELYPVLIEKDTFLCRKRFEKSYSGGIL